MARSKVTTRKALIPITEALRGQGKTIGFTSGAFDLLHAGHVDYLEKAKMMCDVLIVGVNSNTSVKKYKGKGRPIIDEAQRMKVVAGLECVDFVFLFDERRNQKNIEALRPHLYIKADDYRKEDLSSRESVERYSGEVKLIRIAEQISTTETHLQYDEKWVETEGTVHLERRPKEQSAAIFLDRDGTIIEDVGYLHDPEKLKFIPNAIEGIKKFFEMGYRIVIVTNQPGIGIGYFSEEDFYRVNRRMLSHFSQAGIRVDKIYFCPHSKSERCPCRKPALALVQRAEKELCLDLSKCYMIGDKTSDIEFGQRAGMRTILVKTGFRGEDREFMVEPDFRAVDLLEAVRCVNEHPTHPIA
jgi:D-glycero-D-manno-heptose 1,7-bisphosphate phosphatase